MVGTKSSESFVCFSRIFFPLLSVLWHEQILYYYTYNFGQLIVYVGTYVEPSSLPLNTVSKYLTIDGSFSALIFTIISFRGFFFESSLRSPSYVNISPAFLGVDCITRTCFVCTISFSVRLSVCLSV